MFRTGKCPTKKSARFRVVFCVVVLASLTAPLLSWAQEATRIQLRNMQTRKFMKPPAEVAGAIESLVKDLSGTCQGTGMPQIPFYGGMPVIPGMPQIPGLNQAPQGGRSTEISVKGQCMFVDKGSPGDGASALSALARSLQSLTAPPVLRDIRQERTRLEYEITGSDGGRSAVIRLRAFLTNNMHGQGGSQSENPEVYSRYFKMIADGLFVDAVEIGPAVQE